MWFFTESNLVANGHQLVLFVALGETTVVRFILSAPNLAWGVVLVVHEICRLRQWENINVGVQKYSEESEWTQNSLEDMFNIKQFKEFCFYIDY